jgi:hypothetical protein
VTKGGREEERVKERVGERVGKKGGDHKDNSLQEK